MTPLAAWTVASVVAFALQMVWSGAGPVGTLAGRIRGDAGIYNRIAQQGYEWDPGRVEVLGWFPAPALAWRLMHVVTRDWLTAVTIVSLLAGAAAFVAYWRWLERQGLEGRQRVAGFGALLVSPASFYLLGVPYSESLFLAATIAMFLAVERDQLLLAAVLGTLATSTRLVGIVAVVGCVVLAAERHGVLPMVRRGRLAAWRPPATPVAARRRWRVLIPVLGLSGAGAFFLYCWIRFDAPTAYFRVQNPSTSRQPLGWWGTWVHWSWFSQTPANLGRLQWYTGPMLSGVLTIAVATSIPFVARRFGWGYGVYVFGIVSLIWFGSWSFDSGSRYVLAAFPSFALLGEWVTAAGARRSRRVFGVALLGSSALVMLVFGAMFADGSTPI